MNKKYFRIQTHDGQGIFTGLGNQAYPCDDNEFEKLAVNKALCDLEIELPKAPKEAKNNTNSAYTEKELQRLEKLGLIKKLQIAAEKFGNPIEIIQVFPEKILYEDSKQVIYAKQKVKSR